MRDVSLLFLRIEFTSMGETPMPQLGFVVWFVGRIIDEDVDATFGVIMILYLCRHAIAEETSAQGNDFHRALTAEGKVKFRRAAKGFLSLEPEVTHILSSPLLRARQTAEILVEAMEQRKMKGELEICESVGIPADMRMFLSALRKLKGNVLAVGHEPTLSEWIGGICFAAAGQPGCEMKKGAIAAIEMTSASRGTLLWMMRAGQLGELA